MFWNPICYHILEKKSFLFRSFIFGNWTVCNPASWSALRKSGLVDRWNSQKVPQPAARPRPPAMTDPQGPCVPSHLVLDHVPSLGDAPVVGLVEVLHPGLHVHLDDGLYLRKGTDTAQRRLFKDCFSRRDDLCRHENRFLGPTSTLETSFHAGVGCHAVRNNLEKPSSGKGSYLRTCKTSMYQIGSFHRASYLRDFDNFTFNLGHYFASSI